MLIINSDFLFIYQQYGVVSDFFPNIILPLFSEQNIVINLGPWTGKWLVHSFLDIQVVNFS